MPMRSWRGGAVLVALMAGLVCAPARADIPGALTLSGPASDQPAAALDDHGAARLAWRTLDAAQVPQIHFCRLPAGASRCAADTTAPLGRGGYVPAPILEDPGDGSQVRMVVETAATDKQFNGQTVVFSSGDGGATYGAPVASGGGDLILPSVVTGGPGAFSWSALAFGSFLSGPLDGPATTQPVNLVPDGPSDTEEPMGIGFPDPTTPLAVWYHVHDDNGAAVKTITYRHWLGTGSVNDPSTWGPVRDFTPPDGILSSAPTAVASGPKGVFALYTPQRGPRGGCGKRPQLVRYDAAADAWSAPRPIDDDPHAGLGDGCGYDGGGSGSAFSISEDGQGVLHALYMFNSGRPTADQTVPQGLLYSVSSDGGLTWATPVSIANANQINDDDGFRVAVNASGEAILTWMHASGSASAGAVIQARRLPALTAGKPGGSAGPCPAMITVGKAKLLATQGCWAKTGNRFTATGAVRIDGIDLLPKTGSAAHAAAAASVSVDTATRIVTSAGSYQTKIGSVDLGSKPVDWELPGSAGQLLDAASGDPVQLAISGGQTVLGLPVAGIVTPSFGAGGLASIPLNLQLPAPLDGVLGGGLTDDVTFTSDVTRGLHLDRGSIAIDLPEVDLGVARITPFHVGYDADPFVFEAAIGLQLPGGFGSLNGQLRIQNGDLVDLSGAYKPPDPGIAVATGVYLTQVSFGLHKGRSCQPADQTAINIGADLSGGGDVGGTSLLEIDGSAVFKLGSSSCHLPAVFRIDGDGKIVGLSVAHVYFQYTTPALLQFGAAVTLGDDSTGLQASVDGGIDAANGSFFIEGKGKVSVLGYSPASVDVIGSSIGLGACASLDLLPGAGALGLDTTIDAGGYLLWNDLHLTIIKAGCDVSFLKPKDFSAARAAAVGPQRFTVKRGTPSQTFLAFGQTKAPAFVLTSPTGATYASPTAQQQQTKVGPTEGLTLDGNQEASILVHHPTPGTWTVTPQGDEPVQEIRTAAGVVMPRASGVVRSVGHRRFSLAYKVAGAGPDVAVDVFERGRGAQHAIGQLKGSHGVLRFTAAPGPGGRREIVALPHGVGAPPTRSTVIAHYVAPKPAAPRAPRHVGLTRGRGAIRVSWSPAAGAQRYVVRATLRDGRRQEIPVKASRRFAVLQHVPGPDAGAIRVYAIGPDRLISKPALARLKAVHVHRHRQAKRHRHR